MPEPDRAHYLPFGAYAAPSSYAGPPPPPSRTYELPSPRQVVNAGLALALGSSRPIRRASIYIGLLSLGAFGPAAILILIGLARLLTDPDTADLLANDPFQLLVDQPQLAGALTYIYVVGIVGVILVIAISIDARAIAMALLGGAAAENPLLLREAVGRARQTFWRLFWASLLVGVISNVLAIVLAWPFLRPFDSNQGLTFITSMIGTLAVTPFAYAATGIVLGDAGAMETLRRSWRLFRARPRIALVVTLFTLVSAAIQTFAFGAGADVVSRVAEFFHVGQTPVSVLLAGVLVLALIVAFGSLTFTIAAIVSAPQVAAFLGLTFYSGGLDKARTPAGGPPRKVRWVSIPMTVAIVGLAIVAALGIPNILGFKLRAATPLVTVLRQAASEQGTFVSATGQPQAIEDGVADQLGAAGGAKSSDLVAAEIGWFIDTPDWLLTAFDCSKPAVTCGNRGDADASYRHGAFVVLQRMGAAGEQLARDRVGEWGPMLTIDRAATASGFRDVRYPGASDAFITRRGPGGGSGADGIARLEWSGKATFEEVATNARSEWMGSDLLTLVPIAELEDAVGGWDAYAGDRADNGTAWSYDILRAQPTNPFFPLDAPTVFMSLPTFAP